ncbi:MAG: T9SS type A sorting domain-containing protein [Chitinophagaceae bacterium]|nr:T9SS type A sorting domain-containing protein [Chitinophagaceae bacterium]
MKLRFTLLTLLSLLSFISSQAQEVIAMGHDGDTFLGQQGIIDDNKNMVMGGRRFLVNDYPHVALFDQNKVYKWSFYLNKTGVMCTHLIQTRDKNYLAVYATGISSQLIKFDALGNVLWYRDFTNIHSYEDVVEDTASNLYLVGNNMGQLILTKMNASGNVAWSYGYALNPASNYYFGRSIEETHDGNLVVCGVASYVSGAFAKTVAIKIDKSGNIIWSTVLSCSSASLVIDKLIESSSDHTFFGVGYCGTNNSNAFNAFSVKMDTGGAYINNKSIDFAWSDKYNDVCEAAEGGFVAVGLTEPTENCGGNMFYTKFTAANDTVFHKVYGTAAGNGAFFNNIHPAGNGGYYSFGMGSLWSMINAGYEYTYLLTDAQLELPCKKYPQAFNQSSLTITQGNNVVRNNFTATFNESYVKYNDTMYAINACTGQLLSTQSVRTASDISVYPNPSTDLVHMDLKNPGQGHVKVIAMDGKVFYQSSLKGATLSFSVKNWPNGIYLLQWQGENREVYREKIEVSH